VQHQTFIVGSLLVWVSVLEPNRARVPGGLWKIAHILGTRFAGMFLGMAFVIVSHPFYSGFYGDRALEHGLTPNQDQGIAGGMMLGLDFVVMLTALCFLFMRSADDADREARAEELAAMEYTHLAQQAPAGKTGVGLG
jgi:cytochrome c oxidase assembly factor CtaG